jgi:hypothetical protein
VTDTAGAAGATTHAKRRKFMAYDRYDREDHARRPDDRSERGWRGDEHRHDPRRDEHRLHGGRDSDRGFFERAGDEIASWFGGSDHDRHHRDQGRHLDDDRGFGHDHAGERAARERDDDRYRDRSRSGSRYRPMTGDYGRGIDHESEQFFAASGYGRGERGFGGYERERGRDRMRERGMGDVRRESDRSEDSWSRDDYRRTSFAGSQKSERDYDPNYRDWRERHMSEIDRDYHDYRREHQSRFEDDFTGWRQKRQEKRGLLGQIREHMDVVGRDGEHVGTVDKVAGDRIILTKADAESGGAHHSLGCSAIDRIEGDRVMLDCSAKEARNRWRDENRSRALFERHDQGEDGPGVLNRSFSGTYRDR